MSMPLFYRRTRIPGPINGITMPGDIGNISGLALWLIADNISGNDGDAISTWPDSSSLAKTVSQSNASAKPTLKKNIVNTHAVARFDGGDYLSITGGTYAPPSYLFIVAKPTSAANTGTFLVGDSSGTYQVRLSGGKLQILKRQVINIGTANTTVSDTLFNCLGVSYDGSNYAFRLAGAADGSGSNTQSAAAPSMIGGNWESFTGDIAEIIYFNNIISAANVSAVESYLIGKYGL